MFVSYGASVIKLTYIIFPWRIGHVTYGLRSLTNWGFAVGSEQTFVKEILVSYL